MAVEVTASEENTEELEVIESGGEEDETDVLTLERAVSAYFEATAAKLQQAERVAVTRFVSWYGPSRGLQEISAHEMTLFQDAVGANAMFVIIPPRPVNGVSCRRFADPAPSENSLTTRTSAIPSNFCSKSMRWC